MKRREFLKKAGVGAAAAGAVAAPAIVKAQPTISWRLASSFPKSLDTIFGAGEYAAKLVNEMSGGKFTIRVFAGGEIVPGLQVLDAVQNGTVEIGHTAPYYYVGKDPTWAFGTAIPFGLNARQYNAWWYFASGDKLFNEFSEANGVVSLLAGNTGAQMGGWFRKEIKSLADLQGVKMRIGGWGGQIMAKLGAVPQQIAGGEIYQALERGTIDAAEWVGPYDDEKLGFNKVAKFYYYPGWWEGGPALHLQVNKKSWEGLPKDYQAMLTAAAHGANEYMMAKYDAQNPAALRRLVASGTQLRAFPREMMEAAFKAANDLYAETAAKNAPFKKIYESYIAFRNDSITWMRVTENTFDDFMATVKK
ncbi:MAG: TRAP transporter substrate-binding protein [Burkholderiales bacterium]|nr:TRAP transporter substrate-binding protein [Burkholderiales bacterium]